MTDNNTSSWATVTPGAENLTLSAVGDLLPEETPGNSWTMSRGVYVTSLTILTLEALLSVFSNALLIITICFSPSLRTPPNAQLISRGKVGKLDQWLNWTSALVAKLCNTER